MLFFRSKFKRLVADLRAENNLDEENYLSVLDYFKKSGRWDQAFVLLLISPFFIYGLYLLYLYFDDYFVMNNRQKDFFVQIVIVTFSFLFFCYLFLRSQKEKWRNVYLMTCGDEAEGLVDYFSRDFVSGFRWCDYCFFDGSGYQYKGTVKIPMNADEEFNFKLGDCVCVKYCKDNPKFSMIASPGFEFFDLRKRKDEKA